VYDSLVIRARESPGGDRILSVMTAEAGIVDLFVFGGPKSRLRSLASPFASGRAFVYLDPVKDFRKLSDFEARESFPALREDLGRLWSASLVAEILVRTSGGGGDYPAVLGLARDCLAGLDASPPERTAYPIVLFLWRFVALIGLGPEPGTCVSCGRGLGWSGESPGGPGAARSMTRERFSPAYSFVSEGFLCPRCAALDRSAGREGAAFGESEEPSRREDPPISLSLGALRWIETAGTRSFAEALKIALDPSSLEDLKALAFGLARRAADSPLASFSQGAIPV
jgi:DNA repair protein RecO (recombination protein O)